jgi:hypothetical protein
MEPTARCCRCRCFRRPVRQLESQRLVCSGSDGTLAGDITDVFTGVDAARERALLKEDGHQRKYTTTWKNI